MVSGKIFAAVAAIAVSYPLLGTPSSTLAQRRASPQCRMSVGSTTYTNVQQGDQNNVLYLIPNRHRESHTVGDEMALGQLITSGNIQAIALEDLLISETPYPPSAVPSLTEPLREVLESYGTLILGTQDPKTYDHAIAALGAFYRFEAINRYEQQKRLLTSLGAFSAGTCSAEEFIGKFGGTMATYREFLQRSAYADQDSAARAVEELAFAAREELLVAVVQSSAGKGITKMGIKFGGGHVGNLLEKLRTSDYTIFVADEAAIPGDLDAWGDLESNIPMEVKEIRQVMKELYAFCQAD